ncbi:uncharacterized protein LOC129294798 [Prosopis cineraria]|uniref:uncharacterized protein LOC129294798 n=1 Tax=Prosopis cineraria TaxID=364024 RepID=UPI0024103CFD|nr:uncharacterized protein LOC129294798 [Prosopis cineraria]
MVNLTRSSKHKNNVVGRFRHDAGCKKHPKHHQSPGVCSLCLRERLSQLSAPSTSRAAPPPSSAATSSSVSSLSSYYSSSCASSCASPPGEGKTTNSSISIFWFNAKHGLLKSRSMAAASRRRDAVGDDDTAAKSWGFLFNLLRPRHKKTAHKDAQLVRCSSVRQNVTVAG